MFLEDLYNHCKSKNIVLIEDVAHAQALLLRRKMWHLGRRIFFRFLVIESGSW